MSDDTASQLKTLLSTIHHFPKTDRALVERAFHTAIQAHDGQERASGEPYFNHTYETAKTLAELGVDAPTIAAGLLHDTIEDSATKKTALQKEFGDEVLFLVEGVTKLSALKYHGLKRHVESLRKLFVAISQDIRVLIIKLADRLHNMQTLKHLPPDKQKRIALETLEIYAPIAHRLGMGKLRGELEDLAFPFVYHREYEETKLLLKQKSKESVQYLKKVSHRLQRKLSDAHIAVIHTDHRIKRLYSLYRKLCKYDMNIDKIYDIAALRIIVNSVEDCYRVLGVVHSLYNPLPGRVKDYIATPKINGYRSIHTTVFTGDGGIVEIQIRTEAMHREAEYGVASHLAYKDGRAASFQWAFYLLSPFVGARNEHNKTTTETPAWLKQLVESNDETQTPSQFLKNIKTDFFDERVFVFTPKGDVIDLPLGATPIDFAYAIHTDLGNHTSGANSNGKLVSLSTKLKQGDIITIETKNSAHPTRKWLDYAKTNFAKRKIRAYLQRVDNKKK